MRNITVTLEDEVARWVRVRAAELELSVSRYLGRLVQEEMRSDREYELAMERFLVKEPRPLKGSAGGYPNRAELYDRPGVRR